MVLWLKFNCDTIINNSSCTDDHIIMYAEPHRLPEDRGIYRNWGAYFDFGDVLEVPLGVQTPTKIMPQWSVSFWMLFPMVDSRQKKVLIQSIHGEGAYIRFSEEGMTLEVVQDSILNDGNKRGEKVAAFNVGEKGKGLQEY